MARQITHLLPAVEHALTSLGTRIALARSRRRITRKQMAQRAGLTEFTLRRVEQGEGTATIAAYLAVLQALGLTSDVDQVAANDPLGRDLQDAPLIEKIGHRRAARPGSTTSAPKPRQRSRSTEPQPTTSQPPPPALSTDDLVRILSKPAPGEPHP
jgi:transcriptional regulator with XRE-family HTH domain